jgi:hypothetical protein
MTDSSPARLFPKYDRFRERRCLSPADSNRGGRDRQKRPKVDVAVHMRLARYLAIVQPRSMSDSGYQGGSTAGSKWGCAAAALVGAPLFFVLLVADALGDCVPDTGCEKGFLPFVAVPTLVVVTVLFFVVRLLVNRVRQGSSDGS